MALMNRALNTKLYPSIRSQATSSTYPNIAAFSECSLDFGDNLLLDLVRSQLPSDSSRACRARAPPPIVPNGIISYSLSLLLNTFANHGPVIGAPNAGVKVFAGGKLVVAFVVESSDGISIARAIIKHDSVGSSFTGFVIEPTETELQNLADMTRTEVNAFLSTRLMVGSASVTMMSGVRGSASASVMISYINTLGTVEVIDARQGPLMEALKCCVGCIAAKTSCVRKCERSHGKQTRLTSTLFRMVRIKQGLRSCQVIGHRVRL